MVPRISMLSTVPEEVHVIEQVSDEAVDVEAITAAVLGLSFPSVFKDGYKSDVLFQDLVVFYKDLQAASTSLVKANRAFAKSKKDSSKLEESMENAKVKAKVYKWSKSDLAKLFDAIENASNLALRWESNDDNLLQICTNDPANPKCWNIQANVSKITNALKKKVSTYEASLQVFVYDDGAFIDERLYLEPTWEEVETASGEAYIYNKADEKEKYWVTKPKPMASSVNKFEKV